jgi:hypothetical protein
MAVGLFIRAMLLLHNMGAWDYTMVLCKKQLLPHCLLMQRLWQQHDGLAQLTRK